MLGLARFCLLLIAVPTKWTCLSAPAVSVCSPSTAAPCCLASARDERVMSLRGGMPDLFPWERPYQTNAERWAQAGVSLQVEF